MAEVNKILRVVFHADLRCPHMGLELIAKQLKIQLDKLTPGEFVVFVNSKKTQMKLYGAMNAVVHFKNKDDRKIDLKVLQYLPRFFNGKEFRYDDALKEVFRSEGFRL